MSLERADAGENPEPRYDAETLRKVTALADRLQRRHQATLSEREIEAVGAEVGLAPPFIHQALRQLSPPPDTQLERALRRQRIAAFALPGGWAILVGMMA